MSHPAGAVTARSPGPDRSRYGQPSRASVCQRVTTRGNVVPVSMSANIGSPVDRPAIDGVGQWLWWFLVLQRACVIMVFLLGSGGGADGASAHRGVGGCGAGGRELN